MLLSDRNIKVLNSDVEGTTQLVEVTPIKLVPIRIVLGILLSITILFPLLMSWSTLLLKKFFFVECSLDDATHVWVQNSDLQKGISKLTRSQQVSFMNRKLRYVYQYGRFVPLQYEPPIKRELLKYNGCDNVEYNRDLYGRCLIVIPKPNIFIYLLKELTTPFYVLQYASCVLWTLEGFAGLAIIMLSVSLLITTINFFLLQNASSKLREMARNKQIVSVKRHGQFVQIDSDDLVPGDLIAIQNKSKIPCDCVLVSGDLLMNEASLTGESIPIPKVPVEEKDEKVSFVTDKRNCLFEGTKVLVAKPDQDQHHVLAVVARTGFISFKGQIFRAVLYPKQTEFAFYKQAIKFLCYLVIFVLIIYFAELYKLIQLGYSFSVLMYRFLDAITWVIPPALPIFISMCMTFSLVRLKRINIFGIDPQKSLIAGKVNTICFDKTGTLTTIGIDVFGYMSSQECRFNNFRTVVESDRTEFIFKLFATCHGTYIIEGEMMGDSLDIEMFKYSEYQVLQDDTCKFAYQKDDSVLKVMKLYEFESALQRMSVLVQDGDNYYVFAKGSPEKIEELSTFGIPVDYKRQLELLTLKGLRIIALGYRKLKYEEFQKLLKGFRNDCEQNLTFVGLLAMENKLKSDTKDVINNLHDSGLDLKINVRYNDDTIDQMIKIFAKKYGMELASIVRKMVSFDSKKFDCIGLYDAVLSYQIQTLEPQQQHKETLISLTVSQNIYRSQYEPGPQQSFQFIATQQLQNSSGIKLPEDIKQYFRQIQQLQESEQFQPLETINMQQHNYEESIDTSDYIEQTGFQQLEFMKMFDVLSFLKLIPRINKNQIEQKRMISERLYKCTFNGQEKMIKALKGQPTLQAINMLINITNIQSLNLPGLASYDGYLLEECEDNSQQVQVELVFNQMHCTLEKAITQKMLTEGDKYNIANQLLQIVKQFNQFFVHGGLKPSNVYLSQDLKIQILEYGMFRYNKEDIFINTNVSLYNPPEMSNEGVLNKQSDIWSLGLIIYLMFNGKPISAAQNIMLAQQLNLEMENFRMLNLIKKMVVQDPNKRIQIDEVIKEFSFLQNNNSQKSIQNQQQVQYQNQIIIQNQSQNQNQIQNQIQNQQTVKKHNSPPRVSSRDQSRPYIGNPRQYKQVKNQTSVGFFIQGNGMNLKTPTQNKQKK